MNPATFLQTAIATVTDLRNSRPRNIRVLLDGGAQKSFVTNEAVDMLKLPVIRTEKVIVNGFEQKDKCLRNLYVVRLKVWNTAMNDYRELELYVVLAQATYEHLIDLILTDCIDGENRRNIDMLIGANYYWRLTGKVKEGRNPLLSKRC